MTTHKTSAGPPPPPMEPRLQARYQHLVQEHLHVSQSVAAGLQALPGTATGFASTQAAWRFYRNPDVSLSAMVQPLIEQGRTALADVGAQYALVLHDWSLLNYDRHTGKRDRFGLPQEHQQGYELQSALLVSDRDGTPLAPLSQNLRSATGLHTTRSAGVLPYTTHLDELQERWNHLDTLDLGRPLVHIIDREGDSVGHYRQWQPHHFMVRARGEPKVAWEGQNLTLATVAATLPTPLVLCREVQWHGHNAWQYVGETSVVLTRPARPKRRGRRTLTVAGPPVSLRLVVSEVRDANGKVLAQWLLLSNVPESVSAAVLALWYYWRWRIETYFKLLKGAGQQVEQWQQCNAVAIARRLLVASAALVLVWQLARANSPAAAELRTVLVRLSGRQMKRGCAWTMPALLAGTWVLLALLDLLEHQDLAHVRELAAQLFKPAMQKPPPHV